jgi:hypothetical protein
LFLVERTFETLSQTIFRLLLKLKVWQKGSSMQPSEREFWGNLVNFMVMDGEVTTAETLTYENVCGNGGV